MITSIKRPLIFLLFSLPCWATAYTASKPGYYVWGNPGAWTPSGVPGNGDTVTIGDGVNMSVQGPVTIGSSGANGSIAVNLSNTGILVITAWSSLTVRGDIAYTPNACSNTSVALSMQAGSALIWDSSAAASPAATHYQFGPTGASACRSVLISGTLASPVSVSSNAAGGAGYFGNRGFSTGAGSIQAAYANFTNIGDASNPAFQIAYEYSGNNYIQWNAANSTFTHCGVIASTDPAGLGVDTASTFNHSHNVHVNSQGGEIFSRWIDIRPIGTGGIRQIAYNVFDTYMASSSDAFQAANFSIFSNYFGAQIRLGGSIGWAQFQGNFYRESDFSTSELLDNLIGDSLSNLWVWDIHTIFNPHGPLTGTATAKMDGDIIDAAGVITQTSAFLIPNASINSYNYTLQNSIFTPDSTGAGNDWAINVLFVPSQTGTLTMAHNTVATGGSKLEEAPLFSAHTSSPAPTGSVTYQDNILWSTSSSNLAPKLLAGNNNGEVDVCHPANCDYNNGWNVQTGGGVANNGDKLTGAANGYWDNFSSPPGVHDLAVNPMFVDATRNTATFDSAYLQNTAPPWSSGATYSVGSMVSSSNSAFYNGALINYRYTNGTYTMTGQACNGANPQPGLYTDLSRACWEFATLYDLRQGIGSSVSGTPCLGNGTRSAMTNQCLYDDQTIGAHGVDIIMTLIQWIRAGYSPTNSLLAGAAHDGTDIGAVAASFSINGTTSPRRITRGPTIIR